MRISAKWRKHYHRLVELRDHVLGLERDLVRDALGERPAFSMHMADAGTDSYDRDLALSMLSHEQDAVYEIEGALDRIRNGTYGVCVLTGRKIEAARLAAIPWTRFCASAERMLEAQGDVHRVRLGLRESARSNEIAR